MANLRSGSFGNYYGSLSGESEALTMSEMEVNARYIFSYLNNKGWSTNAIAGMLGNIQAESSMNPGRWQSEDVFNYSMGMGLVQWTPATKYINWCMDNNLSDPSQMDHNLARIIYEVENNLQWIETSDYAFSFSTFTKSNQTVSYLAKAFLLNYERPADQSSSVQEYRSSLAENWYKVITGTTPNPENPNPDTPTISFKKRKSKFMLLFNARKRRSEWIRTK